MKLYKKIILKFLEHPSKNGETYIGHMRQAIAYSCSLALATAACFVHAFFPFLFQTTASSTCKKIVKSREQRGEN